MTLINSLGYVVVDSTDLDAWESFATDILGLAIGQRSADRIDLRADDKSARIQIHRSDRDGIRTIGWEVRDAADLTSVFDRLAESGYEPRIASTEEAISRRVTGLARFVDPSGLEVELCHGMRVAETPFESPTGARFRTGEGGLGHILQVVAHAEEYQHLYQDVLEFKPSDYLDLDNGTFTFLHCNPRHHSFAYGAIPGRPIRIAHLMLEVVDMDTVGVAYDKVLNGDAPLAATLGRHSNDQMTSFYVVSPGGFQIEYGTDGLLIDDNVWTPSRYESASSWGHDRRQ